MAGMKRFVTYIYSYEEQKKGGNTGFARIEVRGEDCRIEIHLRGMYTGKNVCRVYLFQVDAGDIVGFPIGEMPVVNGNGEFKAVMKAGQIAASPSGIFQMEGLVLISGDGRMFLSRWTEGEPIEVCTERFRVWEPESVPEEGREQEPDTVEKHLQEPERASMLTGNAGRARQRADMPVEKRGSVRLRSGVSGKNAEDAQRRTDVPAESEEILQQPAETSVGKGESVRPSANMSVGNAGVTPQQTNALAADTGTKEQSAPPPAADAGAPSVPGGQHEKQDTEKPSQAAVPAAGRTEETVRQAESGESGVTDMAQNRPETVAATEIPMRNIFPGCDWQQVWERLTKGHPVFSPFEDKGAICIQIELKDLRELPRRYWYLGNNSFLLHGFFNYRYLVVGRTSEERWFLGVPGIYQRQERVMAAIFGFPEFIPAAVQGGRSGQPERVHPQERRREAGEDPVNQFGCWYRFIEE